MHTADSSPEATASDAAPTGDADATYDASADVVVVDAPADDGGDCNTVPIPTAITAYNSTATAPTPAGGTIAPGLYDLTAATWYDNASSAIGNLRMAMQITSTDIQDVDDESGTLRRENETYTTSGADLTFTTWTCPGSGTNGTVDQYTATATTLDLFWNDSGTIVMFELTKQ